MHCKISSHFGMTNLFIELEWPGKGISRQIFASSAKPGISVDYEMK